MTIKLACAHGDHASIGSTRTSRFLVFMILARMFLALGCAAQVARDVDHQADTVTLAPSCAQTDTLAAFDTEGHLVVFNAQAILHEAPAFGEPARIADDIVFDSRHARLITVERSRDAEESWVTAYDAHSLESLSIVRVDGLARAVSTWAGFATFERSYGERWEFHSMPPHREALSSGLASPRPYSVTATEVGPRSRIEVLALEPQGQATNIITYDVQIEGTTGTKTQSRTLATQVHGESAPRWALLHKTHVLVRQTKGEVKVSLFDGRIAQATETVVHPCIGQLEDVAVDQHMNRVFVLTSRPDSVLTLQMDGLTLSSFSCTPLAGAVRRVDDWYSHSMVTDASGVLWVATTSELLAYSVSQGRQELARNESFRALGTGLRGPLTLMDGCPSSL